MVNVLPAIADIGSIGRTYGEPEILFNSFSFRSYKLNKPKTTAF